MSKVTCYRCSHSGKLLPPDYVENWGLKYGWGLGDKPVSECLNSKINERPNVDRKDYVEGPEAFMFPFEHTCAPVERVEVTEAEFNDPKNRLIMDRDDPGYKRRKAILKAKQKKKPQWEYIEALGKAGVVEETSVWR